MMVMLRGMGWYRATNISICSGSQVRAGMTTWQGRGTCDGQINLFGTNLNKNHSLYQRLPRSRAIPRAPGHVWGQLDAITPAGSTGRSALVSWSLSEGSHSLWRPDLSKARQNITREYWNEDKKLNKRVCRDFVLFYSPTVKLWVKGQGHKKEFLRCWLMGIRNQNRCLYCVEFCICPITHINILLSTTISSDSFVSLCQNMEFYRHLNLEVFECFG